MIVNYICGSVYSNELREVAEQLKTTKYVVENRTDNVFVCFAMSARGKIIRFNEALNRDRQPYRWLTQYEKDEDGSYWSQNVYHINRTIERYFEVALMERIL